MPNIFCESDKWNFPTYFLWKRERGEEEWRKWFDESWKSSNCNYVDLTRATASRTSITNKPRNTECPVLTPSSQIYLAENTVPNTDMTDHSKLAFWMKQAGSEIAQEETAVRHCTDKDLFEIQPLRKEMSSNSLERVQMYHVAFKRFHEQENGQVTLEHTKISNSRICQSRQPIKWAPLRSRYS